jgi:fructoselysine-6-P-deglycase FrlB-like protein
LLILACGTSYHAGLIGKYVIEELLGIPVRVEHASEFNHRERLIIPSAVMAITQSGETADVLDALKKIKRVQSKRLLITNVPNSTATRLADNTIHTLAGPSRMALHPACHRMPPRANQVGEVGFYSWIIRSGINAVYLQQKITDEASLMDLAE